MAKKKAAQNGEPEAVTKCDKLYGYLFGHNK